MKLDPFANLYDIESSVIRWRPRNPFSARLGFLIAALLILAARFAIASGARLLLPDAKLTRWLESNWGWAFIGTVVVYVGYSFCRNFLETKTTNPMSGANNG